MDISMASEPTEMYQSPEYGVPISSSQKSTLSFSYTVIK